MKILKTLLSILSLTALCACQIIDESSYNAQDVKEAFAADYVIDVRTPSEYENFHLKGAILMPVDTISTEITRAQIDRNANIVLYCKGAIRASKAKKVLDQMGYKNVRNIGGLEADVIPILKKYVEKKYPKVVQE